MKLQDIKTEFAKYLVIKDEWAIDIVLATIVGNLILKEDSIWTMIVGISSGGKTSIIAPCAGLKQVHFSDDISEKTFLSAYKTKGEDSSLLKKIDGGIMAFSDFTTILSKNPMSRGEILAQLKMVYDGKFTKHTGTGTMKWEGRVGLIAASTPDIYSHLESSRSMGERFLYYWFDQPTDQEVAKKRQNRALSSRDITKHMQGMYFEYFEGIKEYARINGLPEFLLTEEQHASISNAAIFCVNGKTTVSRDFKSGKVDQIPNKAGVGRDNDVFYTLLKALHLMDCYENSDPKTPVSVNRIHLVEKCAYSSINRERRKILEVLTAQQKPLTASEIGAAKGIGLEKDSVEKYLIPLHAVGLVRKEIGNPHKWYIGDESTKDFVRRVSATVKDEGILESTEHMEVDEVPMPEYQY